MHKLYQGDCLEVLKTLPTGSVDAVVTDPPAGIGFMGKAWDAFGGSCDKNAERDRDAANRGPGAGLGNQPFSYGISNPSPKTKGNFLDFLTARLAEALRVAKPGAHLLCWAIPRTSHWTGTAIEDAGWVIEDRISHLFGTGFPKHKSKLKPACEDWWLATKPGGTKWLNVDGCKIGTEPIKSSGAIPGKPSFGSRIYDGTGSHKWNGKPSSEHSGRWPANLVLSHHPDCNGQCHADCAVAALDRQSGVSKSNPLRKAGGKRGTTNAYAQDAYTQTYERTEWNGPADSGGASRFFYCPKASRRDRDEGNTHPTVKSTDLMRWLCRLVTPQGGVILDPFAGSGSTGKAAVLSGFGFLGIEQDPESFATAQRRLRAARAQHQECA